MTKSGEVWGAEHLERVTEAPLPLPPPVVPSRGFGAQNPPPPLEGEDLRKAAAAFSIRTAVQLDGLRLKQLSWVSPVALSALAALFNATTVTGVFPRQVCRLLVPMLPKKRVGTV